MKLIGSGWFFSLVRSTDPFLYILPLSTEFQRTSSLKVQKLALSTLIPLLHDLVSSLFQAVLFLVTVTLWCPLSYCFFFFFSFLRIFLIDGIQNVFASISSVTAVRKFLHVEISPWKGSLLSHPEDLCQASGVTLVRISFIILWQNLISIQMDYALSHSFHLLSYSPF